MLTFVNSSIKRFHLKEKVNTEKRMCTHTHTHPKKIRDPTATLSNIAKNKSYFPLLIGKYRQIKTLSK